MSKITAFGTYVPKKIIRNDYFEKTLDTNDEWILSRTGIKKRHFAEENEYSSDMCVSAVHNLIANNEVNIKNIDFILVCTNTPDQIMPNTASRVQNKLGLSENVGCNDLYAACAGFVYGLQVGHALVNSKVYKKVLVLGAETLTKATDYTDRTSCILFGDGAGAAIIEPSEKEHFFAFSSGTHSQFATDLYLSHSKNILNDKSIKPISKIVQNGKSVFKWATSNIPIKIRELVKKSGLTLNDIDFIIPHSANLRILESIARELGISIKNIPESVTNYGNTSTASIPLAIQGALEEGKIKAGSTLLLIGFGGGLTFAGTILKW